MLTMKMNDVENSIYMNFNTIEIIYFYDFFKNGGKSRLLIVVLS